jgi:hypothetical protein
MLAGTGSSITGSASTVVRYNLTKNVILVSNSRGNIAASSVSIDALQGGNSLPGNIQAQLNSKANQSTTYTKN